MEKSTMHEGNMYLRRTDSSVYHSILVDTEPKILKPILEVRCPPLHSGQKNLPLCRCQEHPLLPVRARQQLGPRVYEQEAARADREVEPEGSHLSVQNDDE